jgi:hypothetical protein
MKLFYYLIRDLDFWMLYIAPCIAIIISIIALLISFNVI